MNPTVLLRHFVVTSLISITFSAMGCSKAPAPGPASPAPATDSSSAAAPTATATADETAAWVDIDDPTTCAPCHGTIVEEWSESMHRNAHRTNDPVFDAMRTLRMKRQGPKVAAKCANCHNPRAPNDPDSPAGLAGVSCATCHNAVEIHADPKRKGAKAIVNGPPQMLRGPHDIAANTSPAHQTGPALPHLTDGRTMCLSCHKAVANAQGAATCTTGDEFAAHHGEGDDESCVSCHMPEIATPSGAVSPRKTHRSHHFSGPHRAWLQDDRAFMKTAARLTITQVGPKAIVTLENTTGHAFPTGFPGRMAMVLIVAKDAAGVEVWRNITSDDGPPHTQHPEAVLHKIYHDAEGAVTMPPFGTTLVRDSRLKPGETRRMTVDIPANTLSVEASLMFWLIPPKAAKALGISSIPEAKPVRIHHATLAVRPPAAKMIVPLAP